MSDRKPWEDRPFPFDYQFPHEAPADSETRRGWPTKEALETAEAMGFGLSVGQRLALLRSYTEAELAHRIPNAVSPLRSQLAEKEAETINRQAMAKRLEDLDRRLAEKDKRIAELEEGLRPLEELWRSNSPPWQWAVPYSVVQRASLLLNTPE